MKFTFQFEIKKEQTEIKKIDMENFRMFYLLQYDRIDKLETKRENFCNYVLTISAGFYLICFANIDKLNLINSIIIGLLVSTINLASIIFIHKTRNFIKMHQKRASKAISKLDDDIANILVSVKKPYSEKDIFRRSRIYTYLHALIVAVTIAGTTLNHTTQKKSNTEQKKAYKAMLK